MGKRRKKSRKLTLPLDRVEKLEKIVEDVVETMGFDFVEMEIGGTINKGVLRVIIHSPDGVTINDCQKVSGVLSRRLDAEDPFPGSYVLEVSSPGVDRVLKSAREFNIFKGRDVMVQVSNPDDYQVPERFKGVLLGFDGEVVKFSFEGKEVWIDVDDVKMVKLYFSLREALSK